MEYNGCFYDAMSLVYNIITKKYKIYSIRVMFFNEKIKVQNGIVHVVSIKTDIIN